MPDMATTRVFKEVLSAWTGGKRRVLLEGGTASSKTYSALQFLLLMASEAEDPLLISIVSESLPHLRRGCIRDFFAILGESQDNNPFWSKGEFRYHRPNWQATIEFFGADDDGKVRGPRRDVLYINEANNVPWETARGLDIRTSRFTLLDWNPVSQFWAHEYWLDDPANAYCHSTYLDARAVLPAQQVADIESYRDKDPNWWNIYGLGLLGKVEGLVYPEFEQVDELPDGERFYGLDFGYLRDPNALVRNVIIGDKLYSQELLYETGLTNDQIARKMQTAGVEMRAQTYADPSEPKSIAEIREKGFNIREAEKGRGSVEFGIQKVNQFYQYWTKDSLNAIKEQRNLRYIMDRDGQWTDRTTHQFSHLMDARRYACVSYRLSSPGGVSRSQRFVDTRRPPSWVKDLVGVSRSQQRF